MRRRELLAVGGCGLSAAFAGCSEELLDAIDDPHDGTPGDDTVEPAADNPWGHEPIVVGLDREAGGPSDVDDHLAETLRYWEEHAGRYTDHSAVAFDYRPNGDDPDVRVRVVEAIEGCGEHDDEHAIVGCAPVLEGTAPETAEVRVLADLDGEELAATLNHEFGHVLGLGHDDEPRRVMSDDPADRIPDYGRRTELLDAYETGVRSLNEAYETYDDGSAGFDDEEWSAAADRFGTAEEEARGARSSFAEAEALASDLDERDVRIRCQDAVDHAAAYREAMAAVATAAAAYDAGTQDRGDEAIAVHQDAFEDARAIEPADPGDLAERLGL